MVASITSGGVWAGGVAAARVSLRVPGNEDFTLEDYKTLHALSATGSC